MTLEYVTGLEFCNATNAIGVFVLNMGDLTATTRIITYAHAARVEEPAF